MSKCGCGAIDCAYCYWLGAGAEPQEEAATRKDAGLGALSCDSAELELASVRLCVELGIADGYVPMLLHMVDELRKELESTKPTWDATDAAHPCWWRGHDNGAKGMAKLVEELRAKLAEAEKENARWETEIQGAMPMTDRQPEITAMWKEISRLQAKIDAQARELSNTRISRDTAEALADVMDRRVQELLEIQIISNEEYRKSQNTKAALLRILNGY